MPLSLDTFPYEVQVAFFIYDLLTDRWDGMDGVYMGKDWGMLPYYLELYDVLYPKGIVFFLKLYDYIVMKERAEEKKRQDEAEERKSKASKGSGNFKHKVTG